HRSSVVISQRFLVIGAPTRSLARQGSSKRKAYRGNIESHIDPAAAIESALRIRIVEVVYDSRHHHALEFIQLVLEYSSREPAGVEHQILAHEPARVCEPVRKEVRFGNKQQPR